MIYVAVHGDLCSVLYRCRGLSHMLSNNAHFRGSKEQAMRGGRDPVDAQSENKTKAGAGNHMTLVRMLPVLLIACFASFLLGMLWTDRGTVASIELQAQPLQILESGQSRHEEQAGNLSLPEGITTRSC